MNVFVSYSHKDSNFVDKLVRDLNYSNIKATYDKWLLNIGDSIIEKISEYVSVSDSVIIVLSKDSVNSNWVKKELAIAMTGEINDKKIKVYPIVLDDCKIPAILIDKLYANFRDEYYYSFNILIKSIAPEKEREYRSFNEIRAQQEKGLLALKKSIQENDLNSVIVSLKKNESFLAALLGRLWSVSEAIPNFEFGGFDESIDFLVVNGQSYLYEFALTRFLQINASDDYEEVIKNERKELERYRSLCLKKYDDFRAIVAARLKDSFGSEQISGTEYRNRDAFEIKIKIVHGRRQQMTSEMNNLRRFIYKNSNENIEIITYDRLLESIEKSF
jgi:hypothetical protein